MYQHKILGQPPSKAQMATMDARKIEAEILRRLNQALAASENEQKGNMQFLQTVIGKNNALWIQFAEDVANPSNALPVETKRGILQLANFALEHGDKVLQEGAAVAPLIEVNTAIEQGLRGNA